MKRTAAAEKKNEITHTENGEAQKNSYIYSIKSMNK